MLWRKLRGAMWANHSLRPTMPPQGDDSDLSSDSSALNCLRGPCGTFCRIDHLSWLLTMISTVVISSRKPSFIYFYLYFWLENWALNQNPAHVKSTFSTLGLNQAKGGGQTQSKYIIHLSLFWKLLLFLFYLIAWFLVVIPRK